MKPRNICLSKPITGKIQNGSLKCGDKLPERELCAIFNTTRVTIRESLAQLESSGAIYGLNVVGCLSHLSAFG